MHRKIPLILFSRLLLMVMLTVAFNGVHDVSHATEAGVTSAGDYSVHAEPASTRHCPCNPAEQHNDYDGCDTCVNCMCHASLIDQPFKLGYNPVILTLDMSIRFNYLPEVYLSKFIPPQQA